MAGDALRTHLSVGGALLRAVHVYKVAVLVVHVEGPSAAGGRGLGVHLRPVIGPEGGLDELEEKLLNEYGFASTTFGSRILRVETVPLFIMSIINYEYMEW